MAKRKWLLWGSISLVALVALAVAVILLNRPRPAGAEVRFTSAGPTEGVEVRVGDLTTGNTPFTTSLAPGQYNYSASVEGYRPANGQFVIEPGAGSVQVVVPTLTPLGGQIKVRCNASAELFVDGRSAGVCGADWQSLGLYAAGRYQVRAVAPLGAQEQEAIIYDTVDASLEFKWGGRLVIAVTPVTVTAAVTVGGKAYDTPVVIPAEDLAVQPFVQIEVVAPGYLPWVDDVFLHAGQTVTAAVELLADTRPQSVMLAYWRFWEVWNEAGQTLDPDLLAEVMTGPMLEQQTAGFTSLRGVLSAWGISPAPHTPTLSIVSDVTVTLRATFDAAQTTVQKGGATSTQTDRWDGTFTMVLGADGVWRVASWESAVAVVEPTVTPVAGGPTPVPGTPVAGGPTPVPGGGGGAYPPADRGLVAQVILGSINCVRADAGLAPAVLDQEAAAALAALVEEATTTFRNTHGYPPELQSRVQAAAQALGARVVLWSGALMSYTPGSAQWGVDPFEGDWANYVDRPCDTLWATWRRDDWTTSFTSVGIAIGTPYLDGNRYMTTIIVVVR